MKNPIKILALVSIILAVIGIGSAFATDYWQYQTDYSKLTSGASWMNYIDMQGEFNQNTYCLWPNMFYHDSSIYGTMDPAVDWHTYDGYNGEYRPSWQTLTYGQTYPCIASTESGVQSGTQDTGSHSLGVQHLYYYHGTSSNVGTNTNYQPYTVT